MSTKLILYDLPSKEPCACWSLNPWKTRLALNYLKIDYETQWIEYPDLAPTFKHTALEPNKAGPAYTIPTVNLPDGTLLQDSAAIASALIKLHGSDPLRFSHPLTTTVQKAVTELWKPLIPLTLPKIPRNLLNPRSADYFQETRKVRFGMSLDELEVGDLADRGWGDAEAKFVEIRRILSKDVTGPFVFGEEVSYADFIIVSALQCWKRVDEGIYEMMVAIDDSFLKLYEACGEWLERDDH